MTLRESLRRVSSKIRQSAGRKCRPSVCPTAAGVTAAVGPTVKRCRLDYARLHDSAVNASVAGTSVDNEYQECGNRYEVIREPDHKYEEIREWRVPLEEKKEVTFQTTQGGVRPRLSVAGGVVNEYDVVQEEGESEPEEVVRHEYEVIREVPSTNKYEVFRRDCKKRLSARFLEGFGRKSEFPRHEYEVIRKQKKRTRKSVRKIETVDENQPKCFSDSFCRQNAENEYEVLKHGNRQVCYENNLVDEYLDRPENRGTLNPAFEDLTLKSNLVLPTKKPPRAPLQEINIPLNDSFKENYDPNTVVVKRKRKQSVRFEIDEIVEEEVETRKFGNVIFDQNKRRPSILKNRKHLQDDENDSTEELLMKNYELLTKDGGETRDESTTSKFVRSKFEASVIERYVEASYTYECEVLDKGNISDLPLPVVSLYYAPEDRMPSRKKIPPCQKKIKKNGKEQAVDSIASSSDIKVLGISTTDALNQPATLRTDRLCKIVQKFGPEVLMAMGEDGGDSVLAQFKRSLEHTKENPVATVVKEEKAEVVQNNDDDVCRRGKKRKHHAEDVYGEFKKDLLLQVLLF